MNLLKTIYFNGFLYVFQIQLLKNIQKDRKCHPKLNVFLLILLIISTNSIEIFSTYNYLTQNAVIFYDVICFIKVGVVKFYKPDTISLDINRFKNLN